MSFSPFVSVLRVCCGPNSNFPLRQIKTLLHSFVAPSLLFQAETSVSPLEALLESLSVITQPATSEAALIFLDESISRCIRTPFKYIDDYAELVLNILKSRKQGQLQGAAAVSPLVITIVEQFKFFAESNAPREVKLGVSAWLARFMGSCAILGENGHVLAALCNRLVKLCGYDKTAEDIFKLLKQDLEGKGRFQLVSRRSHESTSKRDRGGAILGGEHSRDLFRGLRRLDTEVIESLLCSYQDVGAEVSLFDIAVICKAVGGILDGSTISEDDACAFISKLLGLLKALFERIPRGDELRDRSKAMLAQDSFWVRSFLRVLVDPGRVSRYITFSTGNCPLSAQRIEGLLNTFDSRILPTSLLRFRWL